jgi:hypothetical protein
MKLKGDTYAIRVEYLDELTPEQEEEALNLYKYMKGKIQWGKDFKKYTVGDIPVKFRKTLEKDKNIADIMKFLRPYKNLLDIGVHNTLVRKNQLVIIDPLLG